MNSNLSLQVQPTFEMVTIAIGSFSEPSFNEIPFEGSWTAGQVAQHIKLSVGNMLGLLNGNTEESQRPADQKVQQVADVFLNFGIKMKSPEFIIPQMKQYDQQRFMAFYEDYSAQLQLAAAKLDLTEICIDFELPGFGPMTRLEWLSFVLFHTQRHTAQLERIRTYF